MFAISGAAFIRVNFVAVRMAASYTHPRVFSQTGGNMPAEMCLTFLVSLVAMALIFATLWTLELRSKNASERLRRLAAGFEPDEDDEARAGSARGRSGPARPAPASSRRRAPR